jgi:hypothetical protein
VKAETEKALSMAPVKPSPAATDRAATLLGAKGSRTPSSRRTPLALILAIAALGVLALTATPASAAVIYSTSFGPDGTAATSFEHPAALAADSSSHDLYVADLAAGTVEKFNEKHEPAEFTAGPGAGTDRIAGFKFHPEESGVSQIAVDPSSHVFYVVNDTPTNSIFAFHADGEPAEFTAGPGIGTNEIGGFEELCGVAADANGDIYAGDYDSGFHVYAPSGELLASEPVASGSCNLAVDSNGVVYTNEYHGFVRKFTPSAFPVTAATEYTGLGTVDPNSTYAIAVDPAAGDLYADEGERVAVYDESGHRTGEFAGPGEAGELSGSEGLAVDSSSGYVYVSDAGGARQVEIFGPPPKIPPTVDATYSVDVNSASAELRAQVNPEGYDTHYRFQYGSTEAYGSQTASADLGNALTDQTASASISGLQPETAYHYRVVAENANGAPVQGPDRTFTTAPPLASVALPDRRAWEMVSPLDKNGGQVNGLNADSGGGIAAASPDGNTVTYVSFGSFANPQGALLGSQYLATRDAGAGWLTRNISAPVRSQTEFPGGSPPPFYAFSADLSRALLRGGEAASATGVENPPLDPRAPAGYENYYLDSFPGGYEALLTAAPPAPPNKVQIAFAGASPDLRHVVVETAAALAPGVSEEAGVRRLYEWTAGGFELLTVLPDGTPDENTVLHVGLGLPDPRAVSTDGSRVIWSGAGEGLFVREALGTAQARTVQLDAARGGPESDDGQFLTASPDGSKVFFADRRQLTTSANDPGGTGIGALYEFQLEPANAEGGRLIDLTAATPDAGVEGVLGEGESQAGGTYLYFVAGGLLAANQNGAGETAQLGADNLYVLHQDPSTHEWQTTFIATLSPDDNRNESNSPAPGEAQDWTFDAAVRTARVTPDGSHLTFMSDASLTGYDNAVATGSSCGRDAYKNPLPASCEEVFLYDAPGAGSLRCASCNPSGQRPQGPSGIPGGTDFSPGRGIYLSRALSDDGSRLSFESYDALVPTDANARRDVYEYESGHPYLLSGARPGADASFIDASADGSDVFFTTRAQLVPADTDQFVDLYDARAPHVPGEALGFPGPATSPPCSAACRPATSPPAPLTPGGSDALSGNGNAHPTRRHHHRRHHRSHRRRHAEHRRRHPNSNRRASR